MCNFVTHSKASLTDKPYTCIYDWVTFSKMKLNPYKKKQDILLKTNKNTVFVSIGTCGRNTKRYNVDCLQTATLPSTSAKWLRREPWKGQSRESNELARSNGLRRRSCRSLLRLERETLTVSATVSKTKLRLGLGFISKLFSIRSFAQFAPSMSRE